MRHLILDYTRRTGWPEVTDQLGFNVLLREAAEGHHHVPRTHYEQQKLEPLHNRLFGQSTNTAND